MKNIAAKPKKSRLETLFEMYAHRLPKDGEYACTWNEAIRLDPSKTHRNLQWVLNLIVHNKLKTEDQYKVPSMLKELERCAYMLKRDRVSRDLNSYKSLPALAKALLPYAEELNHAEMEAQERATIDAETEVVFKSDDLLIVSPKTERASCFWGRGTQWCTASTGSKNHFENYTKDGEELFVFIYKGEKYQLHTQGDFLDATDGEFDYEIKLGLYKKIPSEVLLKRKGLLAVLINYPEVLKSMVQTEELCLASVTVSGDALQFINNQTPDICLASARQNGASLRYVKQQTPEICLAAANQTGFALKFVKNKTPEICLAAVKNNGFVLEYVKNKTPEICLAAVTQVGDALQFVRNQTPELCLAAAQQNSGSVEFIRDQAMKKQTIKALEELTPKRTTGVGSFFWG